MSQYERSRAFCQLVSAMAPASTTPRNPRDARIMATAEVISEVFRSTDPFWDVGMLFLAASELRTFADLAAPYGPALIDREQLAQALGARDVAARVLGLAGFYVDGDHWTDEDPDGPPLADAQLIDIPTTFFADRMEELAEEARGIAA